MTKNEEIAHLQASVANLEATIATLMEDKRVLVETLQLALGPKPLGSSTERTRRYRERHGNGHSDVPDESGERHCDVLGGPLGGDVPVVLGETENEAQKQETGEIQVPEEGAGGNRERHCDVLQDSDWLAFREVYPKTDRTSWPKTERRYKALSKVDRAAALAGARRYKPAPEFVKAADGWLLDRRWETVDDAPPLTTSGHKLTIGEQRMAEWRAQRADEQGVIEGTLAS